MTSALRHFSNASFLHGCGIVGGPALSLTIMPGEVLARAMLIVLQPSSWKRVTKERMRRLLILMILFASTECFAQQVQVQPTADGAHHNMLVSDRIANYCDSADEIELSRFKRQALQSVSISGGYIGDLGDSLLSSSFLDLSIGSGIPLGSFDNIIGVKPRFRIDWVDAAPNIDVPSELYQFELQFFYRRPIHDRLSVMVIFSPSIRSDLTTSKNAFRVFALGLLNWECIPDRLTLSGGAVYLGRADLPVLPAIGVSWTPDRWTKIDLRFPVTRISRRLAKDGGRSELWAYLSAGIGGNTWAVTRESSLRDELSLRDIRLTFGIEKLLNGGGGWFAEAGYAMGRKIEYEIDNQEIELDDALLLRGGWSY